MLRIPIDDARAVWVVEAIHAGDVGGLRQLLNNTTIAGTWCTDDHLAGGRAGPVGLRPTSRRDAAATRTGADHERVLARLSRWAARGGSVPF